VVKEPPPRLPPAGWGSARRLAPPPVPAERPPALQSYRPDGADAHDDAAAAAEAAAAAAARKAQPTRAEEMVAAAAAAAAAAEWEGGGGGGAGGGVGLWVARGPRDYSLDSDWRARVDATAAVRQALLGAAAGEAPAEWPALPGELRAGPGRAGPGRASVWGVGSGCVWARVLPVSQSVCVCVCLSVCVCVCVCVRARELAGL
jgi:hypothetical protein